MSRPQCATSVRGRGDRLLARESGDAGVRTERPEIGVGVLAMLTGDDEPGELDGDIVVGRTNPPPAPDGSIRFCEETFSGQHMAFVPIGAISEVTEDARVRWTIPNRTVKERPTAVVVAALLVRVR